MAAPNSNVGNNSNGSTILDCGYPFLLLIARHHDVIDTL